LAFSFEDETSKAAILTAPQITSVASSLLVRHALESARVHAPALAEGGNQMKNSVLVIACLGLGALGTYLGQSVLQGQANAPAVAVPKELTSYRDVVKKVLPAVVSIEASQGKNARNRQQRPGDMALQPIDDENPANVGFGSGFIVNPKGVVVTNNHVVEGADSVRVVLQDGRKFTSSKIARDPKTDLAVIQFDVKLPLPALEFGNSNEMEIGDRVLAVGAPFRLAGTVTSGIISSKGRSLRLNFYEDFLQTDAAINPGNSGGPLVNLEGKVIGINSAIKSRTGGFQGIGLAIASNLAKSIAESLLRDGVVKRGYLGVGIRDVDEEAAKKLSLKDIAGVEVTSVHPDAPGAKAGLKRKDVIRKLGKHAVKDSRDLQIVVAGLPLGKPVDLEVIRDGEPKKLKVTIEEQPSDFGTIRSRIPIEKLGIIITDMTPEWADQLDYPETAKGALVLAISQRGVAAKGGVKAGMLIVKVDKKAVTTAKAASELIAKGSLKTGIELQVTDPKGAAKTITLRERDEEE
jgi:serine protease Do